MPTVWVVDDDEDDQLFIRSAFEDTHLPIRIEMLTDGDQVMPKLVACDEMPRLILLDINMARQNGFETLKQVRSHPCFANLPVLMLTTSASDDDRRRSIALGASQFITKPSDYRQLMALIRTIVAQWELVSLTKVAL